MKKLNKLSINPEKVIKNDELVNLRGGYPGDHGTAGDGTAWCWAVGNFWLPAIYMAECTTDQEALTTCKAAYEPQYDVILGDCEGA